MTELALRHGLAFEDLYARDGLLRIDALFRAHLAASDEEAAGRLAVARAAPDTLDRRGEGDLVLALAPHVDDFLAHLFAIEREVAELRRAHDVQAPLWSVKRQFVQRRAVKGAAAEGAATADGPTLARRLAAIGADPADELAFAVAVEAWLADEAGHREDLSLAERYAAWAVLTEAGRARHHDGVLFKVPHRIDPLHLVPVETVVAGEVTALCLAEGRRRPRAGFGLTDPGTDLRGALDQANYCIWCQHQGKDSCATGLKDRKTGAFQASPFGVTLAGCPLEEKISEMNEAKAKGLALGALAVICVDNPLCAATGHRICNDCMKACIYQKQEPVDIPQAETRTLKDVLALPWGFEIYSLLTRWNPLSIRRPVPAAASGRAVLVVGLGPAGFNLSHHLMNDGHTVVAIDGLKIEPLPVEVSGVDPFGARHAFRPIRDVAEVIEPLDDRVMAGFGGVAEYGITVRWDKNFLKIVRLLLERRDRFAMFGGVRYGGTITPDEAFALGFDHVALCAGAGKPTVLSLPNGLARGVRAASDFLMALQLTGAAKASSVANLQLRLPAVVVGGGLTAIDTATEALAYYVVQVEKFRRRYDTLVAERGEARVRAAFTAEDAGVADEFLAHARALAGEREAARAEGRAPDFVPLLRQWGGVTIAYRRRLIDAPSYTLNHEEVAKAMEEGIAFAEGLTPSAVEVDGHGHAAALICAAKDGEGARAVRLPARAILVAAGTQPNTVLAREFPGRVALDGKYFRAVDAAGAPVTPERVAKPASPEVLMELRPDGRAVSFWGDLHPSFAGNVVKALGGTKQGYPVISRLLADGPPAGDPAALVAQLNEGLRARVHEVIRLAPTIVEVIVHAPIAARAFHPGQFYRLQNFETQAPRIDGTTLAMEGLALTGAWVDKERGLLSTIVLEMGGSSDLCALLRPGEPVVLMGPTGTPSETPGGETVLLAGGGLGNAVLFSIGQALRAAGSRVIYFAGYKRRIDRYHVENIERAADAVVWCCDEAPGFAPGRPQDRAIVANIVEAMAAYAEGRLGEAPIPLSAVDRMIVIGSDRMMAAVGAARHGRLAAHLKPGHVAIASINSPMQCMMKEICAQCLQRQVDPETGAETVVFSCFNQDQPLDRVDFGMLADRLGQNGLHEKLTAQWIDRCLRHLDARAGAA